MFSFKIITTQLMRIGHQGYYISLGLGISLLEIKETLNLLFYLRQLFFH